jgi:hypothetical protein
MKRNSWFFVNMWKELTSNKKLKVHVIKSIIINFIQAVTVMEMLRMKVVTP